MRVLALASQKGGSGKTTLSGHLAVQAQRSGAGPVVLIDIDPQGSLADWWNEREAEMPAFAQTTVARLVTDLEMLRQKGFKLAVVDTRRRLPSRSRACFRSPSWSSFRRARARMICVPPGHRRPLRTRGKAAHLRRQRRDAARQNHLRSCRGAVAARHRRAGHICITAPTMQRR